MYKKLGLGKQLAFINLKLFWCKFRNFESSSNLHLDKNF